MIGTNFGIYRPNSAGPQGQHGAGGVANNEEGRPQGQLSDFMLQLEDYMPSIPDPVIAHYLNSAGFDTNDVRIVRLISLATQKFISDVANDALQHCKNLNPQVAKSKDRKYTLTMEDLTEALSDYGIKARKMPYFP